MFEVDGIKVSNKDGALIKRAMKEFGKQLSSGIITHNGKEKNKIKLIQQCAKIIDKFNYDAFGNQASYMASYRIFYKYADKPDMEPLYADMRSSSKEGAVDEFYVWYWDGERIVNNKEIEIVGLG